MVKTRESPGYSHQLSIQDLTSLDFSSVAIHIFSLKYVWVFVKVFLLDLKRISLNSATAVPVHIVLNNSPGGIGPTSIIEGGTSQYIVRRVIVTARGLFSMRSSF